MKPVCRACFLRLHPLGYDECPIGAHRLSETEPCESNIHGLTELAFVTVRIFGLPSMEGPG